MGSWKKSNNSDIEVLNEPTGAELAPNPELTWDHELTKYDEEWEAEVVEPTDPRQRRKFLFSKAFVHCLYNMSAAARLVKIAPSTAYRWMREPDVREWISFFAIELESKLMERCYQEAIYGKSVQERIFLLKAHNPMMDDKYRLAVLKQQGEQEREAQDRPPRPMLNPPSIPDRIQKRLDALVEKEDV